MGVFSLMLAVQSGGLTQSRGSAAEVSSDSAAAAAVALTNATLIQRVGGEQHAVASYWLRSKAETQRKVSI